MNLTQFICIFTLACSFSISAQNSMVLQDGKQIPATNWDFLCERYALSGKANIQVAKTEKGGVLKITVNTTGKDFFIGGTAYIYLADFTAIACTDKNLRTQTAASTAAYYYLTAVEMARLKKSDIQSIRFNIRGKTDSFSSQVGNFTALNKKSYFGSFGKEDKNIFDTTGEIAFLYQ